MNIAIFGTGQVGQHLYQLFRQSDVSVQRCARQQTPEIIHFEEGAAWADIIVLALPYTALKECLTPLKEKLHGKIIVDCTNPLNTDWSPLVLGENNSAAEEISRLVPEAFVVKAFNTIFADVMTPERQQRDGQRITAFVASQHDDAKQTIMQLAEKSGFHALDVGPLHMARYLEAIAHLNIQIAIGQGGGTNAAFIYHQIKG